MINLKCGRVCFLVLTIVGFAVNSCSAGNERGQRTVTNTKVVLFARIPRAKVGQANALLTRTQQVIKQRLESAYISGATTSIQGKNRIIVNLPNLPIAKREHIITQLTKQGLLRLILVPKRYEVIAGSPVLFALKSHPELTYVPSSRIIRDGEVIVTGYDLLPGKASVIPLGIVISGNSNVEMLPRNAIRMQFNTAGRKKIADFARANTSRYIAVMLDETPITALLIKAPIVSADFQFGGYFSRTQAEDLINILNSGIIPVQLRVER